MPPQATAASIATLPSQAGPHRPFRWLRWVMIAVLLTSAICYVVFSWRWMLICDSPVMHYVNFLMAHGMKPYSDITDNNLPGSYLTEALAMRVFGGGDLAWRIYEFFLLAALTGCMAVISKPYDWAAAIFAGGAFLLLHGKEGPWFAGERELTLTVLIMAGYAATFVAVRRSTPACMLFMGFCTAFAASIKPTVAPLAPLLLVLVAVVLRRRARTSNTSTASHNTKASATWRSYVLYGFIGMVLAALCSFAFLTLHHAWTGFIQMQRTVTPYYASLLNASLPALLRMLAQPRSFLLLPVVGAVLAFAHRRFTWEQAALAIGALVGLLSYFEQRKGFLHHRYLFFVFLLLLIGLEVMRALRTRGWQQWLGGSLIAYVLVVIVPHELHSIRTVKKDSDLSGALQADLQRLGTAGSLQHQVQCLDLVYGCLDALYHLQLVENTGFTGDMIIFDPVGKPLVLAQRADWWRQQQLHPANVLVVTNEYFQGANTYGKLDHWPEYKHYIEANYILETSRSFPDEFGPEHHVRDPAQANGYRIYARRNSPQSGQPLAQGRS